MSKTEAGLLRKVNYRNEPGIAILKFHVFFKKTRDNTDLLLVS